jgi:hypothetical protein
MLKEVIVLAALLTSGCIESGPIHLNLDKKKDIIEDERPIWDDVERYFDKESGKICYRIKSSLGVSCIEE